MPPTPPDNPFENMTAGFGAVSVLDEKGNFIESLKYEDGNTHLSYPLGGSEKYRRKVFQLTTSDEAYNQAKTKATIAMIAMIVAEDGKEYREKLAMKNGKYAEIQNRNMRIISFVKWGKSQRTKLVEKSRESTILKPMLADGLKCFHHPTWRL